MIARDILSTFGKPVSFEAFVPEDKEEEEEEQEEEKSPCIQGASQQVEDDGTRLVKRPRTGSVLPTSSKTEEEDEYCPPIGEDNEYDFFVRGIRG